MNQNNRETKSILLVREEICKADYINFKLVQEHFYGKTIEEVTRDLIRYEHIYSRDFLNLKLKAFKIYLPCIYNYLLDRSVKNSSFCPWTWCIDVIIARLEEDTSGVLIESYSEIRKISNYILDNYKKIDEYRNQYSKSSLFELEFNIIYKPKILFILNKINGTI